MSGLFYTAVILRERAEDVWITASDDATGEEGRSHVAAHLLAGRHA